MTKFGLQQVSFNGCRLGLCTKKVKAIRKPWAFAANMQSVIDAFGCLKCTRDHDHIVCTGDELKRTESYTPMMWPDPPVHRAVYTVSGDGRLRR